MFSWKGAPLKMGPQEGLIFYISTADGMRELETQFFLFHCFLKHFLLCITFAGKVYSVDEHCKTNMLFTVEGSIKKLIFLEKREALAVITDNLMLSQYSLGPEGGAQEFMKVAYNYQTNGYSASWLSGEAFHNLSFCLLILLI